MWAMEDIEMLGRVDSDQNGLIVKCNQFLFFKKRIGHGGVVVPENSRDQMESHHGSKNGEDDKRNKKRKNANNAPDSDTPSQKTTKYNNPEQSELKDIKIKLLTDQVEKLKQAKEASFKKVEKLNQDMRKKDEEIARERAEKILEKEAKEASFKKVEKLNQDMRRKDEEIASVRAEKDQEKEAKEAAWKEIEKLKQKLASGRVEKEELADLNENPPRRKQIAKAKKLKPKMGTEMTNKITNYFGSTAAADDTSDPL